MRTYAFRITCKLAGGDIETKGREIFWVLPDLVAPSTILLSKRGSPPEDQFLILWCGAFTSEAAAQAAGVSVKTAMMLAGVALGVGLNVGPIRRRALGCSGRTVSRTSVCSPTCTVSRSCRNSMGCSSGVSQWAAQ